MKNKKYFFRSVNNIFFSTRDINQMRLGIQCVKTESNPFLVFMIFSLISLWGCLFNKTEKRESYNVFCHSQGRKIFFLLDKQLEFISTNRRTEIHEIGTETFDNDEYLCSKFVELLIA